MPVYQLPDEHIFPRPSLAREDGLLAVGGDLHPDRVLLAYSNGIFPWYSDGEPILWWSPDPRCVLYPEKLHHSKTMKQVLRRGHFRISVDTAFEAVMTACGTTDRPGQHGTWITNDMKRAYCELHQLGYAHSVEVWQEETLVGGLYGLCLGSVFFGESMFAHASNASKAGFLTLVPWLKARGVTLVDCQTHTDHLESLGAEMIDGDRFQKELGEGMQQRTLLGPWSW